jgi:hypothetical protein
MNSLEELNTHGSQSLTVTDNRPATVVFNRTSGVNQIIEITGTSISCTPGIEVLQVVNYATSLPKLIVKIIHSPVTFTSSVSWGTLPSYMTVTESPSQTYTITGMRSEADWALIRSFTWTIPAGYATVPNFYLECKVEYYDASLGATTFKTWNTFDSRFYKIADISSAFTLTANNTKLKKAAAAMTSSFRLVGVNGEVISNMESNFTLAANATKFKRVTAALTCNASVVAAFSNVVYRESFALSSTTSISASGTAAYRSPRANMVSVSNLVVTGVLTNAILVFDTTKSTGTTIYMPFDYDPTLDVVVNWGDGTTNSYKASTLPGGYATNISHTYASAGTYTVKVSGIWRIWTNVYDRTTANAKLTRITTFGSMPLITLRNAFQGCPNLIQVPDSVPTTVKDLSGSFNDCTSFNSSAVNNWNVSSVETFNGMFYGCTAFNQNIGGWQPVSAGTNGYGSNAMDGMFWNATSFNQNLSGWHVPSISAEPPNFDTNTPAWSKSGRQPQWGVA